MNRRLEHACDFRVRASPMSRSRRLGSFSRQRRSTRLDAPMAASAGSAVQSGSASSTARERVGDVVARQTRAPGEHLEQHARRTPRCRRACRRPCPRACSGAHVGRRAENHARLRHRRRRERRRHATTARATRSAVRLQRLRQTEVEHLHRAVGADLDVGRLQIAMDDALLVRGFERLGDLLARSAAPRRAESAPRAIRSRERRRLRPAP